MRDWHELYKTDLEAQMHIFILDMVRTSQLSATTSHVSTAKGITRLVAHAQIYIHPSANNKKDECCNATSSSLQNNGFETALRLDSPSSF